MFLYCSRGVLSHLFRETTFTTIIKRLYCHGFAAVSHKFQFRFRLVFQGVAETTYSKHSSRIFLKHLRVRSLWRRPANQIRLMYITEQLFIGTRTYKYYTFH